LASSRPSSVGGDWTDVAGTVAAFQAINSVRLEVRMSAADHHGRADLAITVIAHSLDGQIGDRPPLASASVTCWGMNRRTLEDVLILALYKLDAQLASGEFARTLST